MIKKPCNFSADAYFPNQELLHRHTSFAKRARLCANTSQPVERTSEFCGLSFTPLENGLIPQGHSYLSSLNRRTIRTTRTPATTVARMSSRYRAIGTTSFLCSLEVRTAFSFPHSLQCVKAVCALLFLFFLSIPAHAYPARVVDVHDGDTITIEPVDGGARAKVRLHGIDAPELKQPFGQAARLLVRKHALFKVVDIQPTPQEKDNGRIVAIVVTDDGVLQELLLDAGLAWVYPKYCKECGRWEALQRRAKAQRKGLWAGSGYMPPWEWREREIL